jgi:hypothetical protein
MNSSTKVYNTGNKTTTSEWEAELNELKQLIGTEEGNLYYLHVRARKAFGSLPTAAVFMEMYVASFRTRDPDGWFFKTYDWWWEHHGLTESNVRTGVRDLEGAGIIEKKRGLGNRMYFRMFPVAVIERLFSEMRNGELPELADWEDRTATLPEQNWRSARTEPADYPLPYKRNEKDHQECVNRTPCTDEEEELSSTGFAGDLDRRHDEDVSEDFDTSWLVEDQEESESHPASSDAEEWAIELVHYFEDVLEETEFMYVFGEMQDWERSQFRAEFEKLRVEQKIDDATAYAMFRRMLERWEHIHLSPTFSYVDVTERYPDRYTPTSIGEFWAWAEDYCENKVRENEEAEEEPEADRMDLIPGQRII